MIHRFVCARWVILACLMIGWTAVGIAAGTTAKSGLPKSTALAKKWHADAVLTSISSYGVRSDGKSNSWLHMFCSPGSKKYLIVTVKGSALEEMEVNSGMNLPITGEFLDSDRAVAEAKKNGLTGNDISVGLNMGGVGKDARLYWSVNGGMEKGDVSVTLDGRTGAFVKRDVMPGF